MKAQINGITVEGTPEEIAQYRQLTEVKESSKIDHDKYIKEIFNPKQGTDTPNWMKYPAIITCNFQPWYEPKVQNSTNDMRESTDLYNWFV